MSMWGSDYICFVLKGSFSLPSDVQMYYCSEVDAIHS
jgi:hypothetical protein